MNRGIAEVMETKISGGVKINDMLCPYHTKVADLERAGITCDARETH